MRRFAGLLVTCCFVSCYVVSASWADDHSSDPATATEILENTSVAGVIDPGDDTDAFRFTPTAGESYDFRVELDTLADSILSLRTATGEVLASNDDVEPGIDLSSEISGWTAPSAESVFPVVESFGGSTGSYRLVVERQLPLPRIIAVDPPRGSTVISLSAIVVTFDQPVATLQADDLAVFGDPATNLTGDNPYTFSGFAAPQQGSNPFVEIFGEGFEADLWDYLIFAEFTLNYLAGPNGSLAGPTSQTVVVGEDAAPVTAVPDEGFRFVRWSDGFTDNPRVDREVDGDLSVTAEFAPIPDPSNEFVTVPGGAFPRGDVFGDGFESALPVRNITLSEYQIGRYEVSNAQLVNVYNWALERGRLTVSDGIVSAFGEPLLNLNDGGQPIALLGGEFVVQPREGFAMEDHPATLVSWYGAAAYCNWRSEREGLTPVYSTNDFSANFTNNGYHLPTEAQWERAAAWDAAAQQRYRYGFSANSLDPSFSNVNTTYFQFVGGEARANPLGLATTPFTSPVGWFNGVNVSPNGNVQTVDAASPAGAYDMSGNIDEWVHDLFFGSYYEMSPATDPTGPAVGDVDPIFGNVFSQRATRGGSWAEDEVDINTAARGTTNPDLMADFIGFRVARPGGAAETISSVWLIN